MLYRKAGNLIQNDRYQCIPMIPFDIPQPYSIWWSGAQMFSASVAATGVQLCSLYCQWQGHLLPHLWYLYIHTQAFLTPWQDCVTEVYKETMKMNHSPVPQMGNLCYVRHACTQQELESEGKAAQIREIIVRYCKLAHIWQVTFPWWKLITVQSGLDFIFTVIKPDLSARDISTEKTDISNQISASGKITCPLFCSPSPLTSTVSYYYFSVFRAVHCFHLFHPISGSEGISSTLGLCYTSSSPTSVTRGKIFVWSFLLNRADCPSALGLHSDTAQFWHRVQ